MAAFYLTSSGYVSVDEHIGNCASIIFYSYDGRIDLAEYYINNMLIGGYGIERARMFTMYFGSRNTRKRSQFGLRVPKPDTIVNWTFDFFTLYNNSSREWSGEIEIDFTQTEITAYTRTEIIHDAGVWSDDIIVRRREKIAWGLCGCEIIQMRGCDCNNVNMLHLPQPLAEEIYPHVLL